LFNHGAFSATYSASSVKIWHPPRTGRGKECERDKGRKMELEDRKHDWLEISPPNQNGQQSVELMV
jgi:hypothetical protein